MNTERVLFFLDLLMRESNGHSDELAEIFNRALNENDDVAQLKLYLNDYNFYREIGNDYFKKGNDILHEVYSSPSRVLELLPQVRITHEAIGNEARACEELMYSPWPFTEIITVLKKKDIIAYMQSLRMIASSCVYLIALYSGICSLRSLTWNDNVGIQEKIDVVNTKFLPALCSTQKSNFTWVIRRRRGGGKALFGSDIFSLNYENSAQVDNQCTQFAKEPIGTHAYLNVNAYVTGETEMPFCWGNGNLVSFTPETALTILQKDVVTKLRAPSRMELCESMPSPYECVRRLADNKPFCVTPDDLVKAMNQWHIGHYIEECRRTHNCLFCGKHISGSELVCKSHFTSELN